MSSKLLAMLFFLSFLAISSMVLADCPPLTEPFPWDREENGALPYFVIHSQADADLLLTCTTFTGDLIISGSNASGPIIAPGPTHIKGRLIMLLIQQTDPRLTFLSISSLVSVEGEGEMHLTQNSFPNEPSSNLTTLSFPVLESVSRWLYIRSLPALTTISLPRLSHVSSIWMTNLPTLHNLTVPRLQFLSTLNFVSLSSLKSLSFPAGLLSTPQYPSPDISIWNTSLSHISGLDFTLTTSISVSSNKNLKHLTFPFLTLASTPYGRGSSRIRIYDNGNGDDFVLDLPRLKGLGGQKLSGSVGAAMSLNGVRAVNVPELQYIGGDLDIGVGEWHSNLDLNYSTSLTEFTAPKLSKIGGSLTVNNSPRLVDVNLPVLRTVGGDIRFNHTAAADLEEGVAMPMLRRVHSVQIIGSALYCKDWEERRKRGVINEWYYCGEKGRWTAEEMEHKLLEDRQGAEECDGPGNGWCLYDCVQWCVFGKVVSLQFVFIIGSVLVAVLFVISCVRMRRRRLCG